MRHTGPDGGSGTTPPVPEPSALLPGGRALFLLSGLPALVLGLVSWQVAVSGPLARADERLSDAVVRPGRFPELLADLGGVPVAVPVLAAVLAYTAWAARRTGTPRWWLPSLTAVLLTAAVPLLVVPLKELFARPGPSVMGPGTGWYPSGHTATAVVAYGAAALLLLPRLRSPGAQRAVVLLAVLLNLAVAFGLVRRGYHWPLDVVASWCLGWLMLLGGAVFLRGGNAAGAHPK